jgi:hypothetical protein
MSVRGCARCGAEYAAGSFAVIAAPIRAHPAWDISVSLSPAALATARRNVAQRIARFIEALEQAPREPDLWECKHVMRALAALDELDFPRGEQAMMWAEWKLERRSPDAMATLSPVRQRMSTAQLRQQFEGIMREAAAL